MKIVCSKSELVNGVNIVSKAVPANTTMSILECILIDASKGEIKFTSNDTEIGIETVVDGTVYSNTIPRFDIAEARIGSIIIKDSIFICIMSEEDSIKFSIPMDR